MERGNLRRGRGNCKRIGRIRAIGRICGKVFAMSRLRKSGGYRELRTFQTATLIYDATYWFCEKFLDSRSRMVDQMVQAARSGRQNIAEGSRAAATSSRTELRLVNVARGSLEELLLDYEDFLRQRHQAQWTKDTPEAQAVRRVAGERIKHRSGQTGPTDFPPCPQSGKAMVLRTAKTGANAGKSFLGCSDYPECKGVRNL